MSRKGRSIENNPSNLTVKKPLLSFKRLSKTRPPIQKRRTKRTAQLEAERANPLREIPIVKVSNREQKDRSLIESFESYYESEEENIEKLGKTQLSYQIYKESHEKGSRRREKILLERVQEIQKENSLLKIKLNKLMKKKKVKKLKKHKSVTLRQTVR